MRDVIFRSVHKHFHTQRKGVCTLCSLQNTLLRLGSVLAPGLEVEVEQSLLDFKAKCILVLIMQVRRPHESSQPSKIIASLPLPKRTIANKEELCYFSFFIFCKTLDDGYGLILNIFISDLV